jgi:hypothetical protein
MWGLINFGVKLASRYFLPRRWPRYVLIASVVLLSILTALLIDARLYWTAAIAGIFAAAGLVGLGVELILWWRGKAERQRLQAEAAARREASAQARAEKLEKIRTSVAEAAKGLGGSAADLTKSSAAGFSDLTKNSAAGLANVTKSSASGLASVTKDSAAGLADVTKRGLAGARDRLGAWRNKPPVQ